MTIELVQPFFSYGTAEGKRLVALFRDEIFRAVAKSDLSGFIFTYVWAFDEKSDWDYVQYVTDIFEGAGAECIYVELCADITARIERNTSPHRLEAKPSKRNTDFTRRELIETAKRYRLNSLEGEIPYKNYMRIDNTDIPPEEAARMIAERFSL